MLIARDILDRIRSGEITLQFRRWRRRTVRAGGTLRTGVGLVGIGEITAVAPEAVTDADARQAGFADAAAFHRWLDAARPGALDRIEVRFIGADPRAVLAGAAELAPPELAAIVVKLDAMDRRAGAAWTGAVMELIAGGPGRPATEIAHALGLDKSDLKARVRRLKAMGLTESLTTGYRLSPRGRAVRAFRATGAPSPGASPRRRT